MQTEKENKNKSLPICLSGLEDLQGVFSSDILTSVEALWGDSSNSNPRGLRSEKEREQCGWRCPSLPHPSPPAVLGSSGCWEARPWGAMWAGS